ncbi:hypothetical protein DFS34DRAFT_647901 [Phlyctochytrium arcticum]|nr:hypothetical protein DFS34DRAFT_647901 [Phlyctochytrium arcticum]
MESQKEEDQIAHCKKLAKALVRLLAPDATPSYEQLPLEAASITADEFTFHYLVESGIIFLTLTEKSFPRLLAYSFLTEVVKSFFDDMINSNGGGAGHRQSVYQVQRPYSFIRFEPTIQSIKKRYVNTRQLRMQEDLVDLSARIQTIPVYDIKHVLGAAAAGHHSAGRSAGFAALATLSSSLPTNIASALHLPTSHSPTTTRRNITPIHRAATSGPVLFRPPRARASWSLGLSLAVFLLDVAEVLWWWAGSNGADKGRVEPALVVLVALVCPALLIQAYHYFQIAQFSARRPPPSNAQIQPADLISAVPAPFPPLLSSVLTVHALLTLLQIVHAALTRSKPAPPIPGRSPIQHLAAWFGEWTAESFPVIVIKAIYILAVVGKLSAMTIDGWITNARRGDRKGSYRD